MNNLVENALKFAFKKHENVNRNVTNIPSISHVLEVYGYLKGTFGYNNRDEVLASAILHDTVEDTDTTIEEIKENFGLVVAHYVSELTKDREDEARIGKEEYLNKSLLMMSHEALLIKLVDILMNIQDNPTEEMLERTTNNLEFLSVSRKDMNAQHLNVLHAVMDLLPI